MGVLGNSFAPESQTFSILEVYSVLIVHQNFEVLNRKKNQYKCSTTIEHLIVTKYNKKRNYHDTCCLNFSALSELLANMRSAETNLSN
jgi:hypothetical protein